MNHKKWIVIWVALTAASVLLFESDYARGADKATKKRADSALERGDRAMSRGEFDDAIARYDEVLQLAPASVEARLGRARAWELKQDPEKALADYDEAIRLDPERGVAYDFRGQLRLQRKDPKQALADFDEAIRLSPEEPLLYLHRADARAALLEWAQALADSRRAVHFATPPAAKAAQAAEDARGNATPSAPTPESTVLAACCNNLAWILATAPDPKIRSGREAVTVATRACKALDWKAGETMDTLAAAYAEAGDFDNAVKWQVKAIELKSDDKSFVEISRERVALYRQRKPYHMPGG